MANFEPWGDGEVRDRRTGQIIAVADFNEVSSPAEKAQFGRDVASRGLLTNQQGEMGSDLLDEEDGPDPDVTPAPRATPGRAEKASPVSRGGPSDDWLARARPLNPGVSDDELLKFHAQKQKKSGPLPSLESWLPRAQAANPDADALDLEEMWQEKYGAKGAPEKNPPDKPWYNDAKEVGRQIVAGAVVDLPRMTGQAMQALSPDGSSVSDYGKELQASAKLREAGWQPDMEGRGSVADAFIRGGRSIAPSLATVAAYLNPYGEVLGPAATVALFGGSQYQEEYDKVKAAGGTDEDARNAGLITGAIQGGGEAIANKLTLGVFGVSKGTAAKAGMTGVVGQATDASILKPWAKASGKAMIGEPATEIAQDVGTSMTERQYGLETPSLLDTAKDSGTAAMAMTALLAPLGLGGHYKNSQRAQAIDKVLSDPNAATPEERQTVVQMLHDEASTLKVPNADLWLQQATEDIQKQRPIRRDVTPTEQLQHGPYNTPQGPQQQQPLGPNQPSPFGPAEPVSAGPTNDPQGPYRPTVRDVLDAPSLDDAIKTANDLLFSPAQEKRAGVEIPILPGREGVDVPPTTLPGRAFTPRTASEPDPRDQLAAERAGLLAQAGRPRQTDQAPEPAPMVDAPLQSASDIAYPPDQRNRMLTAAELVERERLPSKRPAQDPTILNGAEATPDAPIAPGQAFTPRTETELDPRARLAAERAKLVAMRNAKAAPEPAPQATTAPEPIASTPSALPSATQAMPSQPDMPELASPAAPASQQHQENPPSPGTAPIEPWLLSPQAFYDAISEAMRRTTAKTEKQDPFLRAIQWVDHKDMGRTIYRKLIEDARAAGKPVSPDADQPYPNELPGYGTAPINPKLVPKSKRVQQEVAKAKQTKAAPAAEPEKPTPATEAVDEPAGEPFALTAQEPTKPKAKGAEQLSIDVPAEVIGSRPIIGREAQPEEAPLFSKAAQQAEPEQASLPDESPDEQEVWQMTKAEFLKPYLPKSEGGTDSPTSPIGRVERQASMKVDAEFHREQVEKAVKEGKDVPANVLKDYPELGRQDKAASGSGEEPWQMTREEYAEQAKPNRIPDGFWPLDALAKKANRAGYDPDQLTDANIKRLKDDGYISGVKNFVLSDKGRNQLRDWRDLVRENDLASGSAFDDHYEHVLKAVQEGKPVPANVRADYADLLPAEPVAPPSPTTILAKALRGAADEIELGQSSATKDLPNSTERHAKLFSNLLEREPFKSQGFGGLNIPMQRKVLDGVFAAAQDLKIRDAIIRSIPVDVVDYLRRQQLTPDAFFDNKTVFEKLLIPSASSTNVSGRVEMADALVRITAREIAKFINAPRIKRSSESGSTVSAGYGPGPSPLIESSASLAAELPDLGVVDAPGKSTTTLKAREGHSSHIASETISNAGSEGNKPDSKETDKGTALFQRRESTVRSRALPQGADRPLSSFSNNDAVKAHPDYAAAKRGDVEAAIRLVLDLVDPGSVEQAARLWRGATFVAPMAQEASGHNALPQALASLYAEAASGRLEDGLIQTNTPYHTGADAMQRVLTRATFDGPVHADRRYVLVDDVVTMGGTIADLANYVQQQGGQVIGVAVLTNALRSGTLTPSPTHVRLLERRFGDELRTLFGIDASAVTREEAGYLVGFRNIDALRARTATAVLDRQQRLAAKGLSKSPTRSVTSSASSFPRQPLISSNDVSPDRLINRPLSEAELHAVARRIDVGTKAGIAVVPFSGLPHFVQQEAEAQGYPSNEIRGVFHDGQVYLVQGNISTEAQAEETIFHEMYHAWVAGLLGDRKHASLSGIFQKLGGIETVLKLADKYKWTEARSIIKAYGQRKDLSLERRQSIIVDELLATMGQRNAHPGLKWWWSEMVGAMRGWLRAHGFAELARWNEADLAHLLNTARTADLRAGDSTSFMVEPAGQPLFQREGNSPSRSVANQTNTPAFKQWFGESKVVDADGKPLIVYHGTADDIESFNLDHPHRKDTGWLGTGVYLTSDSKLASSYSYMKGGSSHPRVMQLYAKIKNPFYATIQDKRRLQTVSHNDGLAAGRVAADEWTRQLMEQGHDGVILQYLAEDVGESNTSMEMVAFSPSAVKSATSNNGDFDAKNPSILFSRVSPQSRIIGDSGRAHTPAQLRAMQRTGSIVTDKTMKETVQAIWKDAGKKLAQGLVDQFSPVKDLSQKAYTLLRLSKGATGAFEALLHHGKLSIKDGAFDADTSGGVIETVFAPLGRESTDFLRWVAGNRAERLAAEGKENLFTAEDIAAFKSLADDTTDFDYPMPDGTTTRDRTLIYKDALKKFNAFNTNVLDMAEKSGLIDGDSRHLWEHEFYVPFYRAADEQDGGIRGMNIKSGVVRQEAFKQLKGGEQQLNDLLDNTLNNWAHLIDASAKNRAATATLQAAEKAGVAHKAQPGAKKTVWHMGTVDGKHGKVEYTVSDPALLDAISSLEYAGLRGPAMDAMSTMKHWLTIGVTASPFFKVRNLIRDSVQAIATSDLSYNPYSNIKKGIALTNRERQEYVSALAGGGLIRFGTMLEGSEAARVRQLIKQGSKDGHILDGEGKVRAFYDKYIDPAIAAYNDLGNRGEEINRMTLYDTLIKQGKGHAEASLMARDLLDFSMQGTWTSIRFLTQVVPFMNARIQGIAKLGRAAHDDPARFAIVLGATAVASLSLLAAYHDDDDWKKREEHDKDNFWWFKIGGEAFRIPKPFEIGAIATLAERSAQLIMDKEMTGKKFAERVLALTSNQLSMNPIPQAVKPIIDLYANQDSFTGRPIETMGMERLDPSERFRQSTSMVARGLSTLGNAATADHFPSPVQIDHITRAYFGWLGSFVVGGADMLVRGASDEPTRPTLDYWKVATGGMVAGTDGAHSRYVTLMYEQARELEQSYGTWRHLQKEGKTEEAQAYREAHRDELSRYRSVEHVKRSTAKLNERMRMIERSSLSADEKRDKINGIRSRQDHLARQLAPQ